MVRQAGASERPRGEFLKLWGTALTVVCIGTLAVFLSDRYIKLTRETLGGYAWPFASQPPG